MRVLLLNNVPAPYFDPLFEKLGMTPDWQLTICYSSSWNQDVGWQEKTPEPGGTHRTIILDQFSPLLRKLAGSSSAAAFGLFKLLVREKPDYLICYGYTLQPQLLLLCWAMATGTPFAVVGDANYFCDTATGVKKALKTFWLRAVARRAAALITIGTANRRFWEAYGAKSRQLFESRFAVDNDFFARACSDLKNDAAELRGRLGFDGKVVFLFVGRLVKRKNVNLIIQAAAQMAGEPIAVMVVGSGEELQALKAMAGSNPNIHFAGNINSAELPLYYAAADVLVLPADQEPWGLVVNEAMACGLAVIAHKHCGAAVDLVDVDNGVRLESFSADELAKAMRPMAGDKSRLCAMQGCSKKKIQGWTIDAAARGIMRAVESTYIKK